MSNLFSVPNRIDRSSDIQIAKKSNASKRTVAPTVKSGGGLFDKISTVRALVEKNLGKFADEYVCIRDEQILSEYIDSCISNGIYSLDTETTGLDPLQDDIVGICIYTPNKKSAYIPVKHKSFVSGAYVENQLDINTLHTHFKRLEHAKIDCIMFNAVFDIRFMRSNLDVDLDCTWDCYLAARLMNDNEESNALKKLHQKYVLNGEGDAFKFDEFFKGISFDLIPINTACLYAAHDAIITYELYEFQRQYLYYDRTVTSDARNGMNGVSWVFENIEMPCLKVVADMEDTGVAFDFDYAQELHEKYHKELQIASDKVYSIIDNYSDKIDMYKLKNLNHKLSDPINIDSPTQIAIFLYDILGIESVDDKSPRGTGENILLKIDNEFTKALLEYRGVGKLINTYIDKLPGCVNKDDGRIHCKFNQYGADTGRFSSQDPNLQNIPSHNKDIRKMFKATSEDYSVDFLEDIVEVDRFTEVETSTGWKYSDTLQTGDLLLIVDENGEVDYEVEDIEVLEDKVIIRLYSKDVNLIILNGIESEVM